MRDLNKINLRIFSAVLFVPLFIEAFTVFRHGSNSIITAIVYIGVLIFSLLIIRRQIAGKDICILFGIYAFIMLNVVLFPSTFEYYKTIGMTLTLIFYIPICCFVIRHITNWIVLFQEITPFAVISVFLGIYIVFIGDVRFNEQYFNYMEFSYCILPFVASLYVISRRAKKMKLIWWSLFFTSAICMIIYGARATILFLVLFIASFEYYSATPKAKVFVVLGFIIVVAIVTIFFDKIIIYLSGIEGLKDSRLIMKAAAGQLSDGGERDMLISDSIKRITTMDLDISGIFGDRAYIRGIYPHNIGLEIMMQFGIFLGFGILLSMGYLIFVDVVRTNYGIVSIFLTCVLFGRFFFSGSYIQDGNFWIWVFCMLSIFQTRRKWLSTILHKNLKTNSEEVTLVHSQEKV